ncbi:unnamed protein product [Rotaria socialis]|uniref:Uncharacterized protein n=1 Tax=Rotaria socialis TaxID=392032 RepID=A0A819XZ36_9BILA|nr:unnamed protein product [Rotaria socialis]CAF3450615.1 unnamed protein product [Rotaria socialis]CAF3665917.1 unnamed protein product [Rotaria socialis]CAF4146855.1 unnamed protein product [Rotaria socialis]CAF4339267.1 unnamed protein product [Rotaria socialis]
MRALFDQDEDEEAIIVENNRFSQRLLFDIEAYEVLHENFLNPEQCRTWHVGFTLAEKEKRGFFAWRRFIFPSSIPFLNCPVPLSSKLFPPIGTIIYGYLIDSRRCLSFGDMSYRNNTMSKDEQRSMKIDNDDGISITRSYESSIPPLTTYLFFDKIPLWADLLPGRYNLICQMRLRRHLVDSCPNDGYLLGRAPFAIFLLGDRADRGGRWNTLRYPWLKKQPQKYGDDRWFNVSFRKLFS